MKVLGTAGNAEKRRGQQVPYTGSFERDWYGHMTEGIPYLIILADYYGQLFTESSHDRDFLKTHWKHY